MMARPTRLTRLRGGDDDGAALALVLLVSLMVMLLTATVATATVGEIVPAKTSQDTAEAAAAAEAGIDDFLAQVNQNCTHPGICDWIIGSPHSSAVPVAPGTSATFSWRLINPATYLVDGYLRLVSTGRSSVGGRQQSLVADLKGYNGFPSYAYYTQFETLGSNLINARFPARNVLVDNAASLTAIGQASGPLTAMWAAPAAAGTGSPSVCDHYWYTDASAGLGRAHIAKINGADWTQSGTVGAVGAVNYGLCEVTYGTGAVFDGPVYSRDAMLISHTTVGGTGPVFKDRVDTYWGNIASSDPFAPQPGAYRRQQLPIGGDLASPPYPTTDSTTSPLDLPTNASDAPTSGRCTYVGPTRIRLTGDHYAIVTSPQSTGPAPATDRSDCRTNTDNSLSGTGVVSAKVDMRGTTIYVANDPIAPTPATPIFKKSTTIAAPAAPASTDTSSPTATAQWTNPTGSPTCASATVKDQKRFDCLIAGAYPDGYSGAGSNSILNKLASTYASAPGTDLSTFIQPYLTAANSNQHSPNIALDYKYSITTSSPGTPSSDGGVTTQLSTINPDGSDPLLEGSSGKTIQTKTTTTTSSSVTVKGQVYGCYGLLSTLNSSAAACALSLGTMGWGDGTSGGLNAYASAFSLANTRTQVGYTTAVSQATSTFPVSKDVTPYSSQNGDVYIEGKQVGQSSIVAEGDIIFTGDVTYADKAVDDIDLVAVQNARIYHPVQCTEQPVPAGTTAGFCPNDITGLYSTNNTPAWSVHPSQQYTDIRSDLTNISLVGGVFTLNGSFYTDNYDRGNDSLGKVSLFGGVYQKHRGALGEQWEVLSTSASTRKHTGYGFAFTWDPGWGSRGVPYQPSPVGAAGGHTWNVVSRSTTLSLSAS